ncbi:hypothetical protein PV328_007891 [Microctonus aethiopoides]|uniref:TOG domain-containing protein n=1 Tax=Microctonus aethiopoides TaxID=144406 RepID=A0AA39F1K1_9HYME|nr:hypothetical protein PV328_007891 [Microctonus aethiopoides]
MREQMLKGEETELRKKIVEKAKDGTLKANGEPKPVPKKRGRWDQTEDAPTAKKPALAATPTSWDNVDVTSATIRWDETPGHGKGGETPGATPGVSTRMWDATPGLTTLGAVTPGRETPSQDKIISSRRNQTPTPSASKRRSRWDETPGSMTPQTPATFLTTPHQTTIMTPILQPPAGYIPIRTPARKLTATPTPMAGTPQGFFIQTEDKSVKFVDNQPKGNLPFMKPEDAQYFDKLLVDVDEESLSPEEQKERKIMKLLLKIKNGTPPMRKAALRQITDKSREFGAGPLFNQILPLLMSPTLEDQERHLLVKVIDRILYKLDDLVRPYVHKILVVIEPLLIDEDYYARVEGREIISNLAKAAGLATMISTMRPDIDNIDEYVRNTTARIRTHRGKGLAAFLKAIGYLIPLMDAEYANYYTREVMLILIREFQSPDEEMKKIVLKVVKQCCGTDGVEAQYIKDEILPHFFKHFWNHRMALDRRNYHVVMLNGFGTIVNTLGKRVKAYLPQICGTILWRLNNKSAKVRQQAADLISRIAVVMKTCQEEKLMGHLGVVLYEYLGEEYPEVLGSILGALKAIVNVIGMTKMTPPIKDLLPRLTPILKNRHEKVQENCIDLVGRIADRGPEYVSAREWMRICFELLELLKAHKKAIRRAAVNTFGYIAKAIGPHDVLATLLNNLKVQERQNRVCTTVAIAIVAETCSPFTVLPALMNEYRVPDLNVQNGVLKSLSFLFEYIGEMGKDYIYAMSPLLEDALMDRDLVHRQTACAAIKHMALGVYGFGCEDALIHLLNHVWPNVFETSPHLVQAFMDAVDGLRVALGPIKILQYTLQGLFHPARKVRDVYWKIYNSLYTGGQDTLVAGYPRIMDDPKNQYIRYELDYILQSKEPNASERTTEHGLYSSKVQQKAAMESQVKNVQLKHPKPHSSSQIGQVMPFHSRMI